jgi:hypothetical protein
MSLLLAIWVVTLGISPPGAVTAVDRPNDPGHGIQVSWELSPDDVLLTGYEVIRTDSRGVDTVVGSLPPGASAFEDDGVPDNELMTYRVAAIQDTARAVSASSAEAVSRGQWFHKGRLNVLVGLLAFATLSLLFIMQARSGKKLFIRRIAGLDAVEEAVGRATEMGRPILFVPGLAGIAQISTIAALNILSEVAKKTAQYATDLLVPNRDPIVYTVASEMVKEAYTEVGRPDVFKKENVFFVSDNQFAFAAAVDGLMVREKPATNLFMGMFWAESLILAETGATTGAIQIAGTDSVHQLPFFITACDYTLIGEELYAASAYLSRDPLLLGSLKGQDWGKIVILGILLVGSALLLLSGAKGLSALEVVRSFFNVG